MSDYQPEFELDDLNPPSSSRQVGDEIDDELQLVLQDSPSRQELLSSLKRKPLKRKSTGYSVSSNLNVKSVDWPLKYLVCNKSFLEKNVLNCLPLSP